MKRIAAAAALALAASCGGDPKNNGEGVEAPEKPAEISVIGVDDLATRFVKLALAVGQHDAAYVDAYSGPPEWADEAKADKRSLDELEIEARFVLEALLMLDRDGVGPREAGLKNLTTAALTRIRMAKGERLTFDEEARLLYGAAPRAYSPAEFDAALGDIDAMLPGDGALTERFSAFRNKVAIPADRLQAVFDAAIEECKKRTLAHYDLPEGEKFTLRFVKDKPWSGYNWYQGGFESVIEINTDLPIYIDRALDLGCHEGYPGHHVWNLTVDRDLRRGKGWVEYSILPLFSPQSLIGEGSANYGIDLAFPDAEKLAFEREVLFPLAGLDPQDAARNDELNRLRRKLSHVRNYIAREYLEGRVDRDAAIAMIEKYELETPEAAKKRVDFIDQYRAYVINYNLGRDLVAAYIDEKAANGDDRWAAFEGLLKSPDAVGSLAAR